MDPEAGRQLGRIGTQTAQRGLPHQLRRHGKDQRGIHVHRQPRRLRQLFIQLARRPCRAADDDAGAIGWRFLQKSQSEAADVLTKRAVANFEEVKAAVAKIAKK